MELSVIGADKVAVSDTVFAAPWHESLIHQVTVAYLAGMRAGTRAQKTRAEVKGSGSKLWRQKGSGRARTSDGKNNIWRSGGVAFAAKPQDHSQKVNRKMYRAALRSILSELVRTERLKVIEDITLPEPKTKKLLAKLQEWDLSKRVLIITEQLDANLYLSARNLHQVSVRTVDAIEPLSLVKFEQVMITVAALKRLEERLV